MNIQSAAAVFHVRDLNAALTYYCNVLGFEEVFNFGRYAGVKYGRAYLHLSTHDDNRPIGAGTIYIFCDEIDRYYAEIGNRGALLKSEPHSSPYGMRDFVAADPDGNHLAFGCIP